MTDLWVCSFLRSTGLSTTPITEMFRKENNVENIPTKPNGVMRNARSRSSRSSSPLREPHPTAVVPSH